MSFNYISFFFLTQFFLSLESNFDILFIQFSLHEAGLTHLMAIFKDSSNLLLFPLSSSHGLWGNLPSFLASFLDHLEPKQRASREGPQGAVSRGLC